YEGIASIFTQRREREQRTEIERMVDELRAEGQRFADQIGAMQMGGMEMYRQILDMQQARDMLGVSQSAPLPRGGEELVKAIGSHREFERTVQSMVFLGETQERVREEITATRDAQQALNWVNVEGARLNMIQADVARQAGIAYSEMNDQVRD